MREKKASESEKMSSASTKFIALFALVGIGCLGFAAFGTPYFKNSTVEASTALQLNDTGGQNMTNTRATPFHLDFNQVCEVKLLIYPNVTFPTDDTLRVMILTSAIYTRNGTNAPVAVENLYSLPVVNTSILWPQTPPAPVGGGGTGSALVFGAGNQGVQQRIDFMGNGSGTTLYSQPGDYYLVTWVNDTANPDNSYITIDLTVELSGLDTTLNMWFNVAGLACLVLAGVLVIVYLRQEGR